VKVHAPFKVSYDGPFTFRVWGFGLGDFYRRFTGWGYNIRGCAGRLPLGFRWRANRHGQLEVR
jgi:hypothetical protein